MDGFEVGPAPRDEPMAYPGALAPFSFLLTAAGLERLDGVDELGLERGGLDERLHQLGAAPLARRHAVLAYGSNRSPAQLAAKFAGACDPVVPVVRGHVQHVSVVFSAGVATYGSVPASLVVDPGARTEVAVTFLDDDQLATMDVTEGTHHTHVDVALDHGLVLLAGDEVGPCRRYRSSRPVLTWDGEPVRLGEVGSTGSALAPRSQAEVQRLLLDVWAARGWPYADEPAVLAAIRADAAVHRDANEALRGLEGAPLGRLGARTVAGPD